MSNPLNYSTPDRKPSKLVSSAAAFTALIAIGTLSIASVSIVGLAATSSGNADPKFSRVDSVVAVLETIVTLGLGILLMVASVKIRRRSRAWVMVAAAIVGIEFLVTIGCAANDWIAIA